MEPSRQDLASDLVEHMGRMMARMGSRAPVPWSGLDLTMPQVRTLSLLSDGPKRMSDISGYLGSGMPAATSMIDRLVKKRLVRRIEDASDRRVVSCLLTAAGVEVVERFWRVSRQRFEAIAGLLTTEEMEVVVPAMKVLADAIHRESPAVASKPALEHEGAADGSTHG